MEIAIIWEMELEPDGPNQRPASNQTNKAPGLFEIWVIATVLAAASLGLWGPNLLSPNGPVGPAITALLCGAGGFAMANAITNSRVEIFALTLILGCLIALTVSGIAFGACLAGMWKPF